MKSEIRCKGCGAPLHLIGAVIGPVCTCEYCGRENLLGDDWRRLIERQLYDGLITYNEARAAVGLPSALIQPIIHHHPSTEDAKCILYADDRLVEIE